MRTSVYIDGFNLYYGCLRDTPYKWLDLWQLCQVLLPKNTVTSILYCTARVSAPPHDPQMPIRQATYLRALATLPKVTVIQGHFLSQKAKMPLVTPTEGRTHARVIKREEKGSDVNLAVHFTADAYKDKYDAGVLITNDSDFLEAVRIVKAEGKSVGIINPGHKRPSNVLKKEATFFKAIRPAALMKSQFAPQLTDDVGTFRKPDIW